MSVRIFTVSIQFAVRILSGFEKITVRCLSVRPDKDEKELSELSLSLSAVICLIRLNTKVFLKQTFRR